MTTTTAPPTGETPAPPSQVPIWTPGDLNAVLGLGINLLVNVLVLGSLAAKVVHISGHDVNGVILPALGIELLVGNPVSFTLAPAGWRAVKAAPTSPPCPTGRACPTCSS